MALKIGNIDKYIVVTLSLLSFLSLNADKYSLNDNGNIFISIYLPDNNVASSPDKR